MQGLQREDFGSRVKNITTSRVRATYSIIRLNSRLLLKVRYSPKQAKNERENKSAHRNENQINIIE